MANVISGVIGAAQSLLTRIKSRLEEAARPNRKTTPGGRMNRLIFTVGFTKYCVPDTDYWRKRMSELNGVEL